MLPALGAVVLNLQGSDMIRHGGNGMSLMVWAFILYGFATFLTVLTIVIPINKKKAAMNAGNLQKT